MWRAVSLARGGLIRRAVEDNYSYTPTSLYRFARPSPIACGDCQASGFGLRPGGQPTVKSATLRQNAACFRYNASAARLPASTPRAAQGPRGFGKLPNVIVTQLPGPAAFTPFELGFVFDAPVRAEQNLVLLGLPSGEAKPVNAIKPL